MRRIFVRRRGLARRRILTVSAVGALLALLLLGFNIDMPRHHVPLRIVDGDTLSVAGLTVDLAGVDAPEKSQMCRYRNGAAYPCGESAMSAMRQIIRDKDIVCHMRGTDASGHVVAQCFAGSTDIGAAMVRAGWALPLHGSEDYRIEQRQARMASRGLWLGSFTKPWAWREDHADVAAAGPG